MAELQVIILWYEDGHSGSFEPSFPIDRFQFFASLGILKEVFQILDKIIGSNGSVLKVCYVRLEEWFEYF